MLLAISGGLGAVLVLGGLRRRPARSVAALGDMQRRTASRITGDLRRRQQLRQDAAMVGRTLEAHALVKLWALVAGAGLTIVVSVFFGVALGVSVPLPAVVACAAAAGLLGWWMPDSIMKTEAEKERVSFRQSSEAWLELVAQLVTAGSDTHAALFSAADCSEQPAFVAIREAMAEATARSEPPWAGLRRLADDRRLRFLDPFVSALELAGSTGAGARRSVLAQVEAARSKSLHEADAKAASASEAMGAPLALIGGAFMMLMGYPPLASIMSSDAIGGL